MKIIEAMKRIKILTEKVTDLRAKIAQHCANMDIEKPVYLDPAKQIAEWQQSIHDTLKEILSLRVSIQITNLVTPVTIELGGEQVTKPIAAWIHRRRDLSQLEMNMWQALTDRNLKDGEIRSSTGGENRTVHVVRHFDPRQRDANVELFRSEPALIDATLEIINATTELKTQIQLQA